MNIDKALKKILNNTKGKSAPVKLQNQWKQFTPQTRNILRKNYKDYDGDGIPNKWDCSPNNVMRQDSFFKRKQTTEYYPDVTNKQFRKQIQYEQSVQKLPQYGKVHKFSGDQIGNTMIAADVVVPSGKLLTAAGLGVKKFVDNVKVIRTNEHDKKYIIPRLQTQFKGASQQKQNEWANMSQQQRDYERQIKSDSDGDRVPDEYDCQPGNTMRQDFSKVGKTGIPMFDYPDDYLVKKEVVQMTPDEYMKKAYESHYPTYYRTRYPEKSMSFEDYKKHTVSPENLQKVQKTLADPNVEMDIPFLEYKEGVLKEQEGRHRATAAKQLGYETIPVAIVESNKDYLFDQEMQKILRYYEQNPRGKNQGNCHNAASAIANLFLKYRMSTPYSMEVYEIKTKGPDGLDSNHIVLNVHGIYYDPTGTQYSEIQNVQHQSMLKELPSYYQVYNKRDARYLIKKGV